jgi:hypothetical protein
LSWAIRRAGGDVQMAGIGSNAGWSKRATAARAPGGLVQYTIHSASGAALTTTHFGLALDGLSWLVCSAANAEEAGVPPAEARPGAMWSAPCLLAVKAFIEHFRRCSPPQTPVCPDRRRHHVVEYSRQTGGLRREPAAIHADIHRRRIGLACTARTRWP